MTCGTPSGSERGGRGGGVAVRHGVGRAAKEIRDRTAPEPVHRGSLEVADAGERDGRANADARLRARRSRRQPVRRSQPERQVPAGRVADGYHALRIRLLDLGERVDGGGDVLERPRPAASRLAHAPVLDVPREVAARGQVACQGRHRRPVPARRARSRRAGARRRATGRRPRPRERCRFASWSGCSP